MFNSISDLVAVAALTPPPPSPAVAPPPPRPPGLSIRRLVVLPSRSLPPPVPPHFLFICGIFLNWFHSCPLPPWVAMPLNCQHHLYLSPPLSPPPTYALVTVICHERAVGAFDMACGWNRTSMKRPNQGKSAASCRGTALSASLVSGVIALWESWKVFIKEMLLTRHGMY